MRVGVVDLGTNSVRFDIYDINKTGRTRNLHRQKQMIRLGDSVFSTGKVGTSAATRLVELIEDYQYEAYQFKVERLVAYATSALREATNRRQILRLIHERTGIEVQVISGKQEAQLIASGILAKEKRCEGTFGLIDIGGGSTEITGCQGRNVILSTSLPLGVARLKQQFVPAIPPKDTKAVFTHLDEILAPTARRLKKYQLTHFIGSSGTIKTLARVLRRTTGEKQIRLESLMALRRELRRMNRRQLQKVPGLPERRVDLILPGAILLEACMKACRVDRVIPTPFALRDGLLEEVISQVGHA
ncbi:MAG: hypothetical protein H6617_01130 [Bdellovibrionaceae bacterium]|nr:hypothetical protein [Bdellovibrionales bacterium]MCB9253268.1 hypothetical protein [Pseudobdellovibrionaceae bacterium]